MTPLPTQLGDEWVPGPGGIPYRQGARLLLLDDRGRALLHRAHDLDQPERHWWFTPGGGILAGEEPRAAVARELAEETGIVLDVGAIVGPIASRRAVFDFLRAAVRQDELFFVARLEASVAVDDAGLSELERAFMDEAAWLTPDEIDALDEQVYPGELAWLVRTVESGWDGALIRLADEDDLGLLTDEVPSQHGPGAAR